MHLIKMQTVVHMYMYIKHEIKPIIVAYFQQDT